MARLRGPQPQELAINRNASEGLVLVAMGLRSLCADDEIPATSHEHPVGVKLWRHRAERDGLVVREVELPSPVTDSAELIEPLRAAITDQTKVLTLCHVSLHLSLAFNVVCYGLTIPRVGINDDKNAENNDNHCRQRRCE